MHVYLSTLNLVTLLRLCSMPVFKIGLWERQSKTYEMYAADRYTVSSLWFYSLQEYIFLFLWVLANISMFFLTVVTFWNSFLKTEMIKLFCLIQGRYWGTEKLPLNEPLNPAVLLCHVQSKVENSPHPRLFAVPHQSTFWVIFHRYSELIGRHYMILSL